MNKINMKRLCFTAIYILLVPVGLSLHAQDRPSAVVRASLYRFERQDSCMVLDMNIDLNEVRLTPDCTVCLYPWLRNGSDSLMLAPIMINGPQSDRMYRRRKALGRMSEMEKLPPYVVLREGDHPLPCVNYNRTDIPYRSWMDSARLVLRDESYNADARLVSFRMETKKILPAVIIKTDTVILHDTVWVEKTVERPVYVQVPMPVVANSKEIVTEYTGFRADIYFPASGMQILPEHELNREAWHTFVSEIDSLCLDGNNVVIGITVTGYSSPEGSYEANERIAKRRAQALKNFLNTKYASISVEIRTEWMAEGWERLAEIVRTSDMEDKESVLNIIDNMDIFKGREMKLRLLSGGKPWEYMFREYFPKLRCASCRIDYLKRTEK